jgi:hypothetical protein
MSNTAIIITTNIKGRRRIFYVILSDLVTEADEIRMFKQKYPDEKIRAKNMRKCCRIEGKLLSLQR